MTIESRRWVLGIAAFSLLVGIAFELADLGGREERREPAQASIPARMEHAPSAATRPTMRSDEGALSDEAADRNAPHRRRARTRGRRNPRLSPADLVFDSGVAQFNTQARWAADVPNIAGSAGAVSFWLQPAWPEGDQDDASLIELGDGRLRISKSGAELRFAFIDYAGITSSIGIPIGDWMPGEWHQILASWNGSVYMFFVDGTQIQTVHNASVDLPSDTKLQVGSDPSGNGPIAPGVIRKLGLSNRPVETR